MQPFPNGIATLQVRVPIPATVAVGGTLQLTARALDAAGDSVPATFAWSTPDTTITVGATTGLVTGVVGGTIGRVQVRADSVASDLVQITVTP